jgi:hypothetical protein
MNHEIDNLHLNNMNSMTALFIALLKASPTQARTCIGKASVGKKVLVGASQFLFQNYSCKLLCGDKVPRTFQPTKLCSKVGLIHRYN